MMNKKNTGISIILFGLLLIFVSFGLVGCAEKTPSKVVESGETWTVAETFRLSGDLTIADGAVVSAPDGYLLTLTVNGVETPIAAGTYSGDIVLTPTKKISKALYNGKMTQGANTDYRTALFIDAGQVVEESSATSALVGGTYDNTSAGGMTIKSNNSFFGGIIVNDTDYTISDVTMIANGPGGNDFTGYGAGIAITGKSRVTIDDFSFKAVGPLRHGIFIGGEFENENLTVTVKDSFLQTDGSVGDLPAGVAMGNVPWVLGIDTYGRVRTQMIDGYADVTYENTTLLSDGWGVVSTDDLGVPETYGDYAVKLNVKDSIVDITGTSGYGSYSIAACYNRFNNTVMGNSDYSTDRYGLTYALIVANKYAGGEFTNGTHVTAKYGVMWHKTQTGLTRVEDSTFDTYGANFLIKHCYPVIEVSNATLNSDTGVIVQLMSSDDPGLGKSYYTELLDPSEVSKDEAHDIYSINKTDITIFTTQLQDVVCDAQANFSDMEINGNFYNSVAGVDDDDLHIQGENLILGFDNVKLNGAVSAATAIHRNYSFYFAKETDAGGNKIALNAGGYQIDGTWETQSGRGGGMPGGMGMPDGTGGGMSERGMQGRDGGMPEGGMAAGGASPQGGMPGGTGGGMSPGSGMPAGTGGASRIFTPAEDENGDYIVLGDTKHDLYEGVIVSKNATYLGDLVNTPAPAVNNGMIVTLTGGTVWTVAGTSYLTRLTVEDAQVVAPEGFAVEMTVNGKKTKIENGNTYTGDIVLTLVQS